MATDIESAGDASRSLPAADVIAYRAGFLFFFLSGAAALIYELVWLRYLGLVFGNTTYAIATVLAAYMETAELKGLGAFKAIVKHAAPNAIAPIVNVVALNLAYLVVGVVVVEVVFVYPGMGQYMVDAVTVRDMPVVQACGLIFAAVYILLNMAADIVAIVANPRLRHPR